jgi:hypothetical protein
MARFSEEIRGVGARVFIERPRHLITLSIGSPGGPAVSVAGGSSPSSWAWRCDAATANVKYTGKPYQQKLKIADRANGISATLRNAETGPSTRFELILPHFSCRFYQFGRHSIVLDSLSPSVGFHSSHCFTLSPQTKLKAQLGRDCSVWSGRFALRNPLVNIDCSVRENLPKFSFVLPRLLPNQRFGLRGSSSHVVGQWLFRDGNCEIGLEKDLLRWDFRTQLALKYKSIETAGELTFERAQLHYRIGFCSRHDSNCQFTWGSNRNATFAWSGLLSDSLWGQFGINVKVKGVWDWRPALFLRLNQEIPLESNDRL